MNIFIGFQLSEEQKNVIKEALQPGDKIGWSHELSKDESYQFFLDSEVVFGNIPLEWVEKSDNLKWLQLYSTGLDPYQNIAWEEKPSLKVTNLKGFFGVPVAETAVGGILAIYRKLDELAKLQKEHKWVGGKVLRPQMHLLQGKKALILGAGAIGLHIKKLLDAFSCTVVTVSRSSAPNLSHLDDLLPQADIIINSLPETPETVGILDKDKISLMQPSALFVNVGRGSAVDEPALIEALQTAKIMGAVLDVTEEEPLPENHPLWKCNNVLITQHTGGGFAEENLDKAKLFIKNLEKYRKGEELMNLVDFSRGY